MVQELMIMRELAKIKFMELMYNEDGAVDIVAIVVLIGIAVLLALVFQDQLEGLLATLFDTITGNATDAVGGAGGAE